MRSIRASSPKGSEFTDDWAIPIQEDFQHGLYELQPVDITESAEIKPTWKSLFAFTTRAHCPFISLAASSSIISGIIKPASTIFYGKIFAILTEFGSGKLSGRDTLHKISMWCIILTALGVIAWMTEFALLCTWVIFGEIQAKVVRDKMFTALLDKDQEWYDLREDGIGSLLVRIQT